MLIDEVPVTVTTSLIVTVIGTPVPGAFGPEAAVVTDSTVGFTVSRPYACRAARSEPVQTFPAASVTVVPVGL